ncbi:hypothetical protein CA600_21765 [Paenibacillus sp. VTT E-133280]|jgi:hypothetical protein|uniref:hypothetical protein n=1 Tax=Paenibacillus TaxID=44249 RepID=UPI000B9FF093|nr:MULTISPECIES: hypothetical protein [unclassified Paenibacillus]OZQ62532.1 hypothetical protein CA600_21765 [Paenibacillus sp. VTT E-133280]OZQ84963.1 hypothetical protein CA598_22180 [Paenibacillus sp. VTT E-133291]
MANGRNNKKMGGNSNTKRNGNSSGNNNGNGTSEENAELSAEDYEIIAAALATLGEFFAFLSLVKARQVTKETGGEIEVPEIFTLSTKKPSRRKLR